MELNAQNVLEGSGKQGTHARRAVETHTAMDTADAWKDRGTAPQAIPHVDTA